jgi:hypothetical protein
MLLESDEISPDQSEAAAAPREDGAAAAPQIIGFDPPEITRRHLAAWNGMHADTVRWCGMRRSNTAIAVPITC